MAKLSISRRTKVRDRFMEDISSTRTLTPLIKSDILSIINLVDDEMETLETSVLSKSVSGSKTWLSGNVGLVRDILIGVCEERGGRT